MNLDLFGLFNFSNFRKGQLSKCNLADYSIDTGVWYYIWNHISFTGFETLCFSIW